MNLFHKCLVIYIIMTASVSAQEKASQKKENEDKEHCYFHKVERDTAVEWGYKGKTGPEFWGDLSKEYHLAKDGRNQSPINITNAISGHFPKIEFNYVPAKINLVYNGHTIEEDEEKGSSITIAGRKFELKQFHFHAPSEHTIDGRQFDMEMHLVHKDNAGRVAVTGVMIEKGDVNSAFEPIWKYLPSEKNKRVQFSEKIDAEKLLPSNREYYHYMGSFTTPPCTESVYWYVLKQPVSLSRQQIDKFRDIISGNNRPIQPLNGRTIDSTN